MEICVVWIKGRVTRFKFFSRINEQSWVDLLHICVQYFNKIVASLEISFYVRKSVENSNSLFMVEAFPEKLLKFIYKT